MTNTSVISDTIEKSGQLDPLVMFKIVSVLIIGIFIIGSIYAIYQLFVK